MTSFNDLVIEKVPMPGVYHSFNGKVMLGGYEIFRVSDAIIRISSNAATYPEVGSRYAIPYRRQTTVSGNIRRAFVNLYEWALAIGLQADVTEYIAGVTYTGDDLDDGTSEKTPIGLISKELLAGTKIGDQGTSISGGFNRPKNYYPIKTTMAFQINEDELISVIESVDQTDDDIVNPVDVASRYSQFLNVNGVMIDTMQLSVGAAGELITSGPFDWVGESYNYNVELIT